MLCTRAGRFGNGHAFQVLMKCDSVFIFSTASLYYERTCAYVMSSIRGSLDSCPAELCDRIFEFACTDAGYTGRSLSLVSKYVNQTSKRYMLQCVALHGVDKIVAFVGVLERTSKELRRVRHLFICDGDLHDDGRTSIHSATSLLLSPMGLPRKLCLRSLDPEEVGSIPFDQGMMIGIYTILSLISPTIETLCLYFQSRKWMRFPCYTHHLTWTLHRIPPLPRLSELTIGHSPQLPVDYLAFTDMPIMPSLRRLCLWGTIEAHKLWEHIPHFAPSLTHLRLPGTADNIYTARCFLHCSPNQTQLRPTLTRILIQQEALPCLSISHVWDLRAMSYIQWAACKDERLVLLDSDLTVAKYGLLDPTDATGYEIIKSEWLSRISGGDGCWPEMNRNEKIRNYPLAEGDVYWATMHSGALDGFPKPYIPSPSEVRSSFCGRQDFGLIDY
jgi:hypothetical protein